MHILNNTSFKHKYTDSPIFSYVARCISFFYIYYISGCSLLKKLFPAEKRDDHFIFR